MARRLKAHEGLDSGAQRRPVVLADGTGPQRVGHPGHVRLEGDQDRLVLGPEVAQEGAAGNPARQRHVVQRDVAVALLDDKLVGGQAQLGLDRRAGNPAGHGTHGRGLR
jgi:hypothetical protein